MGTKNFVQDYTTVCRTCLTSNVEMLSLCALVSDSVKDNNSKISYMECLKTCIQVEDASDIEMPRKICLDCASALEVSYWFMKNANQAQELLRLKLREIRHKKLEIEMGASSEYVKKSNKRYRCKICNVKVETKRNLKDHVKLHLDIIVYNCQLCSYESHCRNSLCDHYMQIHAVEATKEQLKPKTKVSSSPKITEYDPMDGAIKNEDFQILLEDSPKMSFQTFTKPLTSDTEPFSDSTVIPTCTNYTTISAMYDGLEGELNNDISTAQEYMVMADGSVEKVINKDVIEYIDTPNNNSQLTLEDSLMSDNVLQVQNINSVVLEEHNDGGQLNVDDFIIEDISDVIVETPDNVILPLEEDTIPSTLIEQPKKIMCKICTKDFLTQEHLKNHMLTHNEIPHFFCDQCKFYTFFKIDLHQHYKSKHNLQPTNKQLQPKNKKKTINEVYGCDLCFYEAETKMDIKRHYKIKHHIEANGIQLKPTNTEKTKPISTPLYAKAKAAAIASKATTVPTYLTTEYKVSSIPDYPNGLNCRKCYQVFYWRNPLYEHYKMHNAEEAALKQKKQILKVQNKTISNSYQNKNKNVKSPLAQTSKISQTQLETTSTSTYTSLGALTLNVTTPNISTPNSIAPLTPSSSSTYTLPSDAIPQIVETEQTMDMDVDFNCNEALFEDFEDDVDVENDSDENDSELRNVLLTSDDDFEDILDDQKEEHNTSTEAATTGSYCAHCQKSFLSQYQFENHMFVHRGLAPYRCEMCTNLYNTKRCLIRHYRAVHKNIPTRDMIQAKGDKVWDEKTPLDQLKIEDSTCLMCAKCPYESTELNDIKFHLTSSHNINDESFIMKKQPFECPRCIRSFASKFKLLRHLGRNHSSIPINQQVRYDNVENTSSTTEIKQEIATIINNNVNMMKTEALDTDASCGYNDIYLEQEQHQQHQLTCSDAVTTHIIMTPHEETISPTKTNLVSNESSVMNTYDVTKDFVATLPFAPTALEENHINQPLFKCKICSLTCYNLETFNEHSKRIECRRISASRPDESILFECEICQCNYKTMRLLKHHLKRHIGRKFLCADCPKSFINKIELEAHKYVHSGERPHKCDMCTKSFRYVHHLKRHKDSVHFGKRHECTEPNCGRKFTTLTHLKVHIWAHNGIVPYKCPFCNRLFKKRLLLREHCLKMHDVILSEENMAQIFRNSLGYTNPHDFTVTVGNGIMLRRGDLETMGASGVIKSSFK